MAERIILAIVEDGEIAAVDSESISLKDIIDSLLEEAQILKFK